MEGNRGRLIQEISQEEKELVDLQKRLIRSVEKSKLFDYQEAETAIYLIKDNMSESIETLHKVKVSL